MRNLRNGLVLLVVLIFQIGVGNIFSVWQIVPNFILITILAWCLMYDYSEALIWAFVGGVFLEIYENPVLFGTNIISAVLVVSIANVVIHYMMKEISYWVVFFTGFLGTVLYDLLQFGLKQHSNMIEVGLFKDFFCYNFKLFLWEGLINGLLLILLIYVLQKMKIISSRLRRFE